MRTLPIITTLLPGLFLAIFSAQAGTLDQEKLWYALRAEAARHGATLPEQIRPEDIHSLAPENLSESDAPVEVQGISFDPALHQLRFRFHIAGNAGAPWFSAWCPAFEPTVLSGRRVTVQPSRTEAAAVSTRRLATLHLRSENSFATLQVRPLESGVAGQSIRVRIPTNGHTLRARVTGSDLLEAEF